VLAVRHPLDDFTVAHLPRFVGELRVMVEAAPGVLGVFLEGLAEIRGRGNINLAIGIDTAEALRNVSGVSCFQEQSVKANARVT